MLTICQHHQPIDQPCPQCHQSRHAWHHAVTCYPWEVEATNHEDVDPEDLERDELEYLEDTYGFNCCNPPAIREEDIADWLAERHWEAIVAGYQSISPDPEADAMHDIERHADILAYHVMIIREENAS